MARLKIEMPVDYQFETEMKVRISDINFGMHVGHDRFISMLHEARFRFLRFLGYAGETDIDGQSLLVSDLAVIYKSPAFLGDCLTIQVAVAEFNTYGCDFFYRVTDSKTGALVLEAKTGGVFYDYAKKKVSPVPEPFVSKKT